MLTSSLIAMPIVFNTGCAVTSGKQSAGNYAKDKEIIAKIKAKMYFGIASNDDMRQPDAKDKLKEAFGPKAEIEVYSKSLHGWCVSDMPAQPGMPIYNKPDAERAWMKLVALYKMALA